MQIQLLKSKIHRVALRPYERVLCGNLNNGERFETYAIPGEVGSGAIILNGATAHLGKVGDRLTVMTFATVDDAEAADWKPNVIVLGDNNTIIATR